MVLYTNINNDNKTIEYQMQGNRFAFGYRDRIVNRLKIIPLIDWTTDIDTMRLESGKWKKTDNYVNEMNLDVDCKAVMTRMR